MRQPTKPCYVYVLATDDGGAMRTYVGWTTDLNSRLAAHNSGKGAKSTRGRQWTLLYAERHLNRSDAMSREWYIKRDRPFRRELTGT